MSAIERLDHAIADLGRRICVEHAHVTYPIATEGEIGSLREILHVEGFGGREDRAVTARAASRIAAERLHWLRDMRSEGLR